MPYLKRAVREKAEACFFCDYVGRPRKDRTNLVLLRGRNCFVLLNRFPYTTGHLMVAPRAHKGELEGFTGPEREELFELVVRMEGLLRKTLSPHGFNIGLNVGRAAGAGVPGHLHVHIVPRWNGDTNFMTTVGHAKVIPQALLTTYDRLQKAVRKDR
jgi:ATP adenylyltransferase